MPALSAATCGIEIDCIWRLCHIARHDLALAGRRRSDVSARKSAGHPPHLLCAAAAVPGAHLGVNIAHGVALEVLPGFLRVRRVRRKPAVAAHLLSRSHKVSSATFTSRKQREHIAGILLRLRIRHRRRHKQEHHVHRGVQNNEAPPRRDGQLAVAGADAEPLQQGRPLHGETVVPHDVMHGQHSCLSSSNDSSNNHHDASLRSSDGIARHALEDRSRC